MKAALVSALNTWNVTRSSLRFSVRHAWDRSSSSSCRGRSRFCDHSCSQKVEWEALLLSGQCSAGTGDLLWSKRNVDATASTFYKQLQEHNALSHIYNHNLLIDDSAPSLRSIAYIGKPYCTSMSLFAQSRPAGTSLFAPTNNQPSTGLFGSAQPQPTQANSLFGQSQPAQSGGLFGSSTTQPKPATTSLFGNTTTQQPGTTSLFGNTTAAQPSSNSLFGASTQQPQNTGLFGQSTQQPAQNSAFTGALGVGIGTNPGVGALNTQTQRDLAQSRLQAAGLNSSVREKTVPQQISTLVDKWSPESSETLLQTYLYNAANPNFAPFYHPAPGESEKEYETALVKKPEPVDGNTWVPVLVRGFKALGERVEFQAKFVQSMQVRLHEMNNSLTAIMNKHSQDLSVRTETAKKQHIAISQRTMRLAVKCQVLRNRGYALDAQEETLRTSLLALQKQVQDPASSSREEAVWARMVVLRERTRWLEEETKRLGNGPTSSTKSPQLPQQTIQAAKKVLRDYDAQIQQLSKELREVQAEFLDIQGGKAGEKS